MYRLLGHPCRCGELSDAAVLPLALIIESAEPSGSGPSVSEYPGTAVFITTVASVVPTVVIASLQADTPI